MSKTFHAGDDTGFVYATIDRSEHLRGLIRSGASHEEIARAFLAHVGQHPHAWSEWSDAVHEALLSFNENRRGNS